MKTNPIIASLSQESEEESEEMCRAVPWIALNCRQQIWIIHSFGYNGSWHDSSKQVLVPCTHEEADTYMFLHPWRVRCLCGMVTTKISIHTVIDTSVVVALIAFGVEANSLCLTESMSHREYVHFQNRNTYSENFCLFAACEIAKVNRYMVLAKARKLCGMLEDIQRGDLAFSALVATLPGWTQMRLLNFHHQMHIGDGRGPMKAGQHTTLHLHKLGSG